jgi:hypothetical protein
MLESKKWSPNLTHVYRENNNTIIYIYIPVELIGWYCFLDQSIALTTYLIPQDCKEAQNWKTFHILLTGSHLFCDKKIMIQRIW